MLTSLQQTRDKFKFLVIRFCSQENIYVLELHKIPSVHFKCKQSILPTKPEHSKRLFLHIEQLLQN